MTSNTIHPDTTIASVHLNVSNMERSLAFYTEDLGFELTGKEGKTARLGAGGRTFLVLTEESDARRYPDRTGLYHFAILVPSRLNLAHTLQHMADSQVELGGFADHLVSEAIYLSDPDGNGIEIYRDRPRAEWQHDASGGIRMATDPLDLQGLIGELRTHAEPWSGIAPGTRLGHMHLQVANVRQAEDFYTGVLGFNTMAHYGPSAAFVSAGGYHHHIGMNTWQSAGATPPPPNSIGLVDYEIRLLDRAELDRVLQRVRQAEILVEETPEGMRTHDPSQNGILLTYPAAPPPSPASSPGSRQK